MRYIWHFFAARADYIGGFIESFATPKFPHMYGDTSFVTMTIDFCILGCADDEFEYAGLVVIITLLCILAIFNT